jgi:rhodanese-related sulfurtransferase
MPESGVAPMEIRLPSRIVIHRTTQPNGGIIMSATLTMPDPVKAREYFEDKMSFTTGPVELERAMKEGNLNIIDVRAAEDFRKGHIPGAVNLPKEKWDSMEGLSRDRTNVLYCYSQACHLAATAALQAAERGFPVIELEGGFAGWKENQLPVEK